MDLMQWVALAVFVVTILVVISNVVDNAVAAMLGAMIMVWIGVMSEIDAFQYVDWNVMAILVSIWVIAGYFGKTGVPSWLALQALRLSGGRPGLLVMLLSVLAGVISMFVDNVVTILMMAPVALPLARALKIPITPLILMIGFSANFMGTALLLGDLPPQMLHSVSGAEFGDFIWQFGRPSSFPILMVTFAITLGAMYAYGFRAIGRRPASVGDVGIEAKIPDPLFATLVVGWFLLTVAGMAFREALQIARQAGEGAEVRRDNSGTRLARDFLLHRAVCPRGRARKDEYPRVACPLADAHLPGKPGTGRHAALLGHRSHRRAGRA
jgi:Na+/H+ antiporter NhaD/arsenite permease-like protein